MKTCCFTGSRPYNLPWVDETDARCQILIHNLKKAVWNAVKNEGYTHFITGMALGIDTIAADIIIKLRAACPELGITLEAAIPCPSQSDFWINENKKHYNNLLALCDKRTLVSEHYFKGCYFKRNRYMVDNSSLVIAVTDGRAGGTMQTVKYAKTKCKTVILIEP